MNNSDRLSEIFNREMLAKLNALSLKIENRLQGGYEGARRSKGKGSANEFSDFREYHAGDDIRRIDWNSYARTDKLMVKLFTEEKQAAVNIFVDTSMSMGFGEPSKLLFAKVYAAALAYLAMKAADSVSVYSFGGGLSIRKENAARSDRFPEVLMFLETLTASGKTDIKSALASARTLPLKNGLLFVLSDFFSEGEFTAELKSLREKRQEITLVHILSPEEENPTELGRFRLVDSETGAWRDVICDEAFLKSYAAGLGEMKNRLREICVKNGMRCRFVNSSDNVIGALAE